jgi:hypothetical protein
LRWRKKKKKKKKKKKARRFYLKGVASDWQWRGLGVRVFHWICLFSSKKPGLLITFRLMVLAHWDFLGGGFEWSKEIGFVHFGFL